MDGLHRVGRAASEREEQYLVDDGLGGAGGGTEQGRRPWADGVEEIVAFSPFESTAQARRPGAGPGASSLRLSVASAICAAPAAFAAAIKR